MSMIYSANTIPSGSHEKASEMIESLEYLEIDGLTSLLEVSVSEFYGSEIVDELDKFYQEIIDSEIIHFSEKQQSFFQFVVDRNRVGFLKEFDNVIIEVESSLRADYMDVEKTDEELYSMTVQAAKNLLITIYGYTLSFFENKGY